LRKNKAVEIEGSGEKRRQNYLPLVNTFPPIVEVKEKFGQGKGKYYR
jgi:hypothetical protein